MKFDGRPVSITAQSRRHRQAERDPGCVHRRNHSGTCPVIPTHRNCSPTAAANKQAAQKPTIFQVEATTSTRRAGRIIGDRGPPKTKNPPTAEARTRVTTRSRFQAKFSDSLTTIATLPPLVAKWVLYGNVKSKLAY